MLALPFTTALQEVFKFPTAASTFLLLLLLPLTKQLLNLESGELLLLVNRMAEYLNLV